MEQKKESREKVRGRDRVRESRQKREKPTVR